MNETAETNSNELEKSYKTTSVIVIILIVSTLALIGIAWFLAANVDNSVTDRALSALWVTIILLVVTSFVLRRVLFSRERLKQTFLQRGRSGLILSLQNKTVFLCLIGEIIAIIGFLVATLGGNKFEMFRAGAVALVVFLFNFPHKTVWQRVITNLEKV